MKQGLIKRCSAIVSCMVLLLSLMSVGAVADNGLELLGGVQTVHFPLATMFYPYCTEMPDGVAEEDLSFSFSNEAIVQKAGEDYGAAYQMIAAGETELTVSTADGRYTDTVTLIADAPHKMAADRTEVYVNAVYQMRTFLYTAPQSGYYQASVEVESDAYCYVDIYDASFTPVSDGVPYLTKGEQYYICPIVYDYENVSLSDRYELLVTFLGEEYVEEVPDSLVFAEESITISLYDEARLPSFSFEPGGDVWYDSVTFEVEDESILTVDADTEMITTYCAGTTTLTAKADSYGWSDSIEITVVDEKRDLSTDGTAAITLRSGETATVFFTAPETKTYILYSVTEGDGDPYCVIYDDRTGDELGYGDDTDTYDFMVQTELTKGQTIRAEIGCYTENAELTVYVEEAKAATGVEMIFYNVLSKDGETVYVASGLVRKPNVRFLGGTVMEEEYEVEAYSESAQPDEYGEYTLSAGQSVTFTVVTENGLTDTVTVVAIDLLAGDLDLDGAVDAMDAATAFYTLNGLLEADAATLGAMELTGDNRITLADAARLFYYVNGLTEEL